MLRRRTRAAHGLLQLACSGVLPLSQLSSPPLPCPSLQITCRILPVDDYRFGLLWQWNLYESMLYSPYVAARLQTYTGARVPVAPGAGEPGPGRERVGSRALLQLLDAGHPRLAPAMRRHSC